MQFRYEQEWFGWSVSWKDLQRLQEAARGGTSQLPVELRERAATASDELLENAARYAIASTKIAYQVRDTSAGFDVNVTNDTVSARSALLQKRVRELTEGNVETAYRAALERLANDLGGGFGLIRIRKEARVSLSVVAEGRTVTVSARGVRDNHTPAAFAAARGGKPARK